MSKEELKLETIVVIAKLSDNTCRLVSISTLLKEFIIEILAAEHEGIIPINEKIIEGLEIEVIPKKPDLSDLNIN